MNLANVDNFAYDFAEDWLEVNERAHNMRVPKKYIRDGRNLLEYYHETEFIRRFSFTTACVLDVLMPLSSLPKNYNNNRGLPIPPILQLLSVLRFYATGSFQIVKADLHGISQASVCILVKKISLEIALKVPNYIKFPDNLQKVKTTFFEKYGFPGVVGAIDCTHIPIQNPNAEEDEIYRNRKGSFSLNVEAVCDPNLKVFDLVYRWPGRTHDSRIFNNSALKTKIANGNINEYLLGDKGYAQTAYMYTPVHQPQDEADENYNRAHDRARKSIERCFGVLKRRFSYLRRKLATKLPTTTYIITACTILHNIAIEYNQPLFEDEDEPDNYEQENNDDHERNENNRVGAAIRRALIEQYFT